jgi:hypothetical protein
MSTIALELTPELEQQIQDEAAKQGLELKHYILKTLSQNLSSVQLQPKPLSEFDLLQKISIGLSPETWDSYHALINKRRVELLNIEEEAKLIEISDRIEQANIQRLNILIELAKLRNTSLIELMQDLGIKPPEYV